MPLDSAQEVIEEEEVEVEATVTVIDSDEAATQEKEAHEEELTL